MTATFGKLQGRSLELGDGLNIIEAPNETGKSTWCAFLLSILYGVNSRERDRAGFIADKNRFAPWSGAAMSGRMDCGTELGELTLTRATRRQTSPMGEFSAVYAGTNEPVPGLTGAACGETLLGISREVFERSAFIRQSVEQVAISRELAGKAGQALESIERMVLHTADQVSAIAAASEQQSASSEEVNKNTEAVSHIARDVAQAMTAADEGMQELNRLAGQLQSIIRSLKEGAST